MAEQPLADRMQSPPTPPAKSWILKTLIWAIIGAVLGALWAFFHSGTDGSGGSVLVLAVSFGLAGAVFSLLVGSGCRT